MKDRIGFLQQLGGPQGEKVGIAGTGAHDVGDAGGGGLPSKRIKFIQRETPGAGLVPRKRETRRWPFDQAAEKCTAASWVGDQIVHPATKAGGQADERPDALRQSGLDPGTQHAGERGRSTTGRDRDQHTIALDDRGHDEVAKRGTVHHVHRYAGGLGHAMGRRVATLVVRGHERRDCACKVVWPKRPGVEPPNVRARGVG